MLLQILIGSILVMTVVMCFTKAFVDGSVLPYVTPHAGPPGKKKKKKKDGERRTRWSC